MISKRVGRNLSVVTPWLKGAAVAAAVVAITIQWVNTRVAIVRVNQAGPTPVVLDTYPLYHSMATGMGEGRIGQVDLLAVRRYALLNNPSAPYERLPREADHQWVDFYTLDVGYSFIVEVARLAFRSLPDNHLRALALQLVVDAVLVGFVFYLFSQWNVAVGLLAAVLYSSNQVFFDLVSFSFYYYWDIPLSFFVLGSILLAFQRPRESVAWLTAAAAAVGFGVWLRGSWWPIGLFLLGVVAFSRRLRQHLLMPVVIFTLLAAPQVARASYARGGLTLSTRTMWHVALVGLGYYPNPYGLEAKDAVIFKLTKDKYGVEFRSEDYWLHDQAARKEYLAIWRKDPGFVIKSFLGRLEESLLGTTQSSVPSFTFLSNLTYRILCLLGFVAMMFRGGDRRMLAIAAGGTHVIYVVLTCIFYFVGLAYENVSEVTRFILFVGAIDSALYLAQRAYQRLPVLGAGSLASGTEVPSGA